MVYFSLELSGHTITEEGREETWRQEPKQRPWGHAAYWLPLHGFSYTTQGALCPEVALPTVGWALQRQSLIKKMVQQLDNKPPHGGISSVKISLSRCDASLCEIGKKLTSAISFVMLKT